MKRWPRFSSSRSRSSSRMLASSGDRYAHLAAYRSRLVAHLHRAVLLARAAQGLQAYPPIRLARPRRQGGETGAGARGPLGADTRSGGHRVGRGVHGPHQPDRVVALHTLRNRQAYTDCAHRAGACTASAWAAMKRSMRSRSVCLSFGAVPRQGAVRPLGRNHAIPAFVRGHLRTSLPVLSGAPTCRHLLGHFSVLPERLNRPAAGLQTP